MSVTEKELIQGCVSRNPLAQRSFFDQYYQTVFAVVRRYISQKQDVEDVVIIVFNKALNNIYRFEDRGDDGLKRWLVTIAINESLRFLKQQPSNKIEELSPKIAQDSVAVEMLDIEMIFKILASMPAGYRQVFNLYAIDQYTHSEIANLLGISRNTSKSQLLKARKYIINVLKKTQSV